MQSTHHRLRLIEVLGPSGVGKTSALNALFQNSSFNGSFLNRTTPEEWLPLQKRHREESLFDESPYRETFDLAFRLLGMSDQSLARRMKALDFCKRSLITRFRLDQIAANKTFNGRNIVHDELVLHRAFSILPFSSNRQRDAREFFKVVPAPDRAVICIADPQTILGRILERPAIPNCYRGLATADLQTLLFELVECCFIARDELTSRGIATEIVQLEGQVQSSAASLRRGILGLQ